ncbi:MAG: hypothetical protein U0Q22_08170 [Acidimicrobiales bacterium]
MPSLPTAPRSPRSGRAATAFTAVAFTAIGIVLYGPDLGSAFLADDYGEIWKAVGDSHDFSRSGSNFRPLHLASLAFDHAIGGLDPLPYKITNLALHVACALVVIALAAAMARAVPALRPFDRPSFAVLAGLWFFVSPAHTEAVSWIAARADLLVTLFGAASVLVALGGPGDRSPSRARSAVSLVLFALALASKESAVVIPVVLLVIDVARSTGPFGARARSAWLVTRWHLLVLAPYPLVRWLAIHGAPEGYGLGQLFGTALGWPKRTAAIVVRSVLPALPAPFWWIVPLLIGVALVAVALRCRPLRPLLLLTAALVFVTTVPSSGLGASAVTPQGERLAYLPSVFAALLVAGLVASLHEARVLWGRAAAVAVVATSIVGLVVVEQRWIGAAELAERFVAAESVWDDGTVPIVANLPDAARGILVGRNIVNPSLAVRYGWAEPRAPGNLAAVALAGDHAHATVRRAAPQDGRRTWLLELPEGDAFTRTPGVDDRFFAGVRSRIVDERHLSISLDDDVDAGRLWYFTDGRLRRFPAV